MAAEWIEVSMGELVHIKHGFAFKGEYFSDEERADALITPGNFAIGGGFQEAKTKYYAGPVPNEFVLVPGSLVVTMTDLSKASDTLGYAATVPKKLQYRLLHNQRVGLVELRAPERAGLSYLHWVMRSPPYRHEVLASASGSTVRHTSPSRICAYRFHLPSLEEQRRIAAVLGALDDKIELNRRMNRTLEEMAQAIFKSWFIDFDGHDDLVDSEIGPVPRGWEVGSIYEVAEVRYGAPFKSKLFNEDRRGHPLIRIRDLQTHDPGVFTPEAHPRGFLIRAGDIVVGMDGEFRAHIWRGPDACLNQRLCQFVPIGGAARAFVYFAVKEPLAFFERSKTGTTVIHLGKRDIDTFKVVLPPRTVLAEFDGLADPLLRRIVANELESRTLAALRDTLLPKLISGELRVPEAEDMVEEAS